jgi:hypothetical protein
MFWDHFFMAKYATQAKNAAVKITKVQSEIVSLRIMDLRALIQRHPDDVETNLGRKEEKIENGNPQQQLRGNHR